MNLSDRHAYNSKGDLIQFNSKNIRVIIHKYQDQVGSLQNDLLTASQIPSQFGGISSFEMVSFEKTPPKDEISVYESI